MSGQGILYVENTWEITCGDIPLVCPAMFVYIGREQCREDDQSDLVGR